MNLVAFVGVLVVVFVFVASFIAGRRAVAAGYKAGPRSRREKWLAYGVGGVGLGCLVVRMSAAGRGFLALPLQLLSLACLVGMVRISGFLPSRDE